MANKIIELLPDSILFKAKNKVNSNLHKALNSFNSEQEDKIKPLLDEFAKEYSPFTTTDLLSRWEAAVGIPDDCFSVAGTSVEQRRNNVIVKLISRGASSNEDYARILELLGVTNFRIINGRASGVFPLTFPITIEESMLAAVSSITLQLPEEMRPGSTYPLTFPAQFGTLDSSVIECYMRKIIPANYSVKFEYNL